MTEPERTFEDLKHCPKCKEPGEDGGSVPAPGSPKGTRLHTIYCRNERCKWLDTPWFVQVNPDGSVPKASDHTKRPKLYVGFEGHDQMANQIRQAIEADDAASLKGAEVRRRPR